MQETSAKEACNIFLYL